MTRYVAFLRGINLGSRRVKMAELRKHVDELELTNVDTFLASGNVIFDRTDARPGELEKELETHLADRLGFSTEVFLRSTTELDQLVTLEGIERARNEGFTPYVTFLRSEAGEEVKGALTRLSGPEDRFEVVGREVIWYRRGRLTDSDITTSDLEAAMGREQTRRKLTTVERILKKFGR